MNQRTGWMITYICIMIISITGMSASAQEAQVRVQVDGLTCPFCAYGLEKKLKAIDGVEKLEINIEEGVAVLTFRHSDKIDEEQIGKAVKDAGFTPGEITVEKKSDEQSQEADGRKVTLSISGMT